jgi:hypothetical protein
MPCPYFAFSTYPPPLEARLIRFVSVDLNGLNGLNATNFSILETAVWFVRSRSARP